ncbi:MAG TPA: plasma-membrane proton-efflux P-type ATPase [Candidatus Bathyarchaeia archaeon]|nr:plasma-membrane proton-efflux P-type ATPase [Candidatus Bathyarchaeia archaeon]
MSIKKSSDYGQLTLADAFTLTHSSSSGLTDSEAKIRIQKFGFNEIPEKRRSAVVELLSRYWGPMPWLLEVTIVLSYLLNRVLDSLIIFGLLTTNALIGFQHSRSSQRALEVLKTRLAIKAKVLRDGKWVTPDARELVPGDIIAVTLGDLVPADSKIIDGSASVDQSALTGESLLVNVRPLGILYSGSIVKRGQVTALVVNTGTNTFFGRTAELVKIAKPKSHQEQIMFAIIKYMMLLSIGALVIVAIDAVMLGISFLRIVTFALVFLMGAVPVALPAVFSIVLAAGAIELAKKSVLVTRLDSIEDAASMDVLCLDKTGTLTLNKLTVADPIPYFEFRKEDVANYARLASKEESEDPIDLAVIEYATKLSTNQNEYRQISFTPFEPETKRSEAVVESSGQRFSVVKGAPQVLISLCEADDQTRSRVMDKVEDLSSLGYRTLAVAKSNNNDYKKLRFVGLLPLSDPPRPDSKQMIQALKESGVKPKMLTGDNASIAREIAKRVGIGVKIYRMSDFSKLNEPEQTRILEENDGLAEIFPEDKYQVVKLLQTKGHLVGMTGDGVNDSPALKQAEVGIAVDNATDVAKASSSIVLTEPGIRIILEAIKTSREIYQRMLTWVINKVTKVIQFVGILVIGFFWFHDLVISVLGVVLLVFANDFVTMSLATDNVKHTTNPNLWDVKKLTWASLAIGVFLIVEGAIGILLGVNYFHLSWIELRTFALLILVFTSQFRVLIVRERNHFWSSRPGRALITSTSTALFVFVVLGVYGFIIPSIPLIAVVAAFLFSLLFTLGLDFPKYFIFKHFGL